MCYRKRIEKKNTQNLIITIHTNFKSELINNSQRDVEDVVKRIEVYKLLANNLEIL